MEISVIVPTYQRPLLLKRCLQALLSQKIDVPYEIIVVIDGPGEAIELPEHERLSNVRIVTMEVNSGPAAARNYGFMHAKGELIVFTDDDCIPHPDLLSSYWNSYNRMNWSHVAFTGKVTVPINADPTDHERNIKQLETAEFLTANCALNRNAFTRVGGFDETYTMAWREDSDLHFNLLEHDVPILHVPQAVVEHPVRKAMWNISLISEKKNMFNVLLYKKFPSYYSKKVKAKPPLSYYAMIFLLPIGIAMTFIWPYMSFMIFLLWAMLVLNFALSRICRSSSSRSHVAAMMITSALIPFLSVYWNFYGNIKFKSWLV
jgi:GT2 family glycosyltransferase